jgi:hypothetical protein
MGRGTAHCRRLRVSKATGVAETCRILLGTIVIKRLWKKNGLGA